MKRVLIVVGLATLLVLSGCGGQSPLAEDDLSDSLAELQQASSGLRAEGVVTPSQPVDLSFPASGRVIALEVEEGVEVSAGDTLAELETTNLESDLARAQAVLVSAEANLDLVKAGPVQAEIDGAERAVEDAQESYDLALNSVVLDSRAARAELTSAQTQLALLQSQPRPEDVAIAEAQVQEAQTEVDAAQVALEQATMTAPFDGTIMTVYLEPYEYTDAGQPVIQMADMSSLKVVMENVDDANAIDVNIGDPATVTFRALSGVETTGEVTRIVPLLSELRGASFDIEVTLDGIPESVRWGIAATVEIGG